MNFRTRMEEVPKKVAARFSALTTGLLVSPRTVRLLIQKTEDSEPRFPNLCSCEYEQRPINPGVVSSNPAGGTRFSCGWIEFLVPNTFAANREGLDFG